LALAVICVFALPVYFGLWAIYTYVSIIFYVFTSMILLKMTICIKLETDWAKAAAKAIKINDLDEAKKYSHFSRRDTKSLNGSQISSAVIESMAENPLFPIPLSETVDFTRVKGIPGLFQHDT
jgi:cobalamin biosynthesis protein CobD/CbiB